MRELERVAGEHGLAAVYLFGSRLADGLAVLRGARGHGRGALEYREVARLAGEHGLVTAATAGKFEEMAGFRNRLTHFCREVTPVELRAVVASDLEDIER